MEEAEIWQRLPAQSGSESTGSIGKWRLLDAGRIAEKRRLTGCSQERSGEAQPSRKEDRRGGR